MLRIPAALLALAVVVGGCASSSSSSPSTGTTAPLANTTTAPPLSATTTPASGSASASPRPAPDGDAFYTPPSPLPAGQPGDLIWARPFTGPANSQGYEVLYLSSTVDDQPVAVSGVVIVPGAGAPAPPPEGRTILTWAHGTTGLGDACAPSRQYVSGQASELLLAQVAVSRGFVYAATDYQGLGPPGDHPYLVGLSEGRNVLDAARAAERLATSNAGPTSKVVVWGHSQGGGAALFAAQLAPTYAPDLDVVGSVAGAPAAQGDAGVQAAAVPGPYAGFILMAVVGYHAGYPNLKYADLLNDAGQQAVADIADECLNTILAKFAGKSLTDYANVAIATAPGWAAAIAANEPGQTKTSVPIFLYHGESDQIVPVQVSADLLKRYCALGVPVSRKTYPGADHTSVIPAALTDIVGFIDDRLAGQPPPSSC